MKLNSKGFGYVNCNNKRTRMELLIICSITLVNTSHCYFTKSLISLLNYSNEIHFHFDPNFVCNLGGPKFAIEICSTLRYTIELNICRLFWFWWQYHTIYLISFYIQYGGSPKMRIFLPNLLVLDIKWKGLRSRKL